MKLVTKQKIETFLQSDKGYKQTKKLTVEVLFNGETL